MSQQINLFGATALKSKNEFSLVRMVQGLGVILFCAALYYAYTLNLTMGMENQLQGINQNLATEQGRLAGLAADLTKQRSGMTLEQQLKKVEAEAAAQREIINALKNGVIGNTRGYSEYMRAFARQAISGLWLTGFVIDGDATQMSISGAALTPELVPEYILRLKKESVMRGKSFASLQMQLPKLDSAKPGSTPYLEFNLHSVGVSEADK